MKLAINRKAHFEYSIVESFNAGIVLLGSEVKSIREGNVNISDCYIFIRDGEVWAKNMKVARYKQIHVVEKHDENRDKKLLLNHKEINKIEKLLQDNGTTIIPLDIFTSHNKVKVNIAVVKGKKLWDKRDSIKKKDVERDMRRSES